MITRTALLCCASMVALCAGNPAHAAGKPIAFSAFLCIGIAGACLFAHRGEAQTLLPVYTSGLTSGQCVQSTGTSAIGDAPCPGRTTVISAGATLTLASTNCGAVVANDGAAYTKVTLPASPPANCEFTFVPSTRGFYINFNGKIARQPGFTDDIAVLTIPMLPYTVANHYRSPNSSISLQFVENDTGGEWVQSAVSSSIFHEVVNPNNVSQLVHGQVYFQWNSSASRFELCPQNGPGGLIVDSGMKQIPIECLTLIASATTASHLNYFYAVHGSAENLAVAGAADNGSGYVRLLFASPVPGNVNDQVGIQ